MAALVLNPDGAVQFANGAAEHIVTSGQGLRFAPTSGALPGRLLVATDRRDHSVLQRLVGEVAVQGWAGGALRLHLPRNAAPGGLLAVSVSPLPSRLAGRERGVEPGVALLVLRSLGAPSPATASLLHDLFDLTAAEAAVASHLVGGNGLADVAAQRGVGLETVRSQARTVLRKTGSANLREFERLVAVLMGS